MRCVSQNRSWWWIPAPFSPCWQPPSDAPSGHGNFDVPRPCTAGQAPMRMRRSPWAACCSSPACWRWDADGGRLVGSARCRTVQADHSSSARYESLSLPAVGCDFTDVAKLTIYLIDLNRPSGPLAKCASSVFGTCRPASTLVQVASLIGDGTLMEIEAIAGLPRPMTATHANAIHYPLAVGTGVTRIVEAGIGSGGHFRAWAWRALRPVPPAPWNGSRRRRTTAPLPTICRATALPVRTLDGPQRCPGAGRAYAGGDGCTFGIETAVLVGTSLGAHIVAYAACRAPSRICGSGADRRARHRAD